jgi:hypothetical protein
MAWVRHGHGMASVNQTRPHCVNQMGKTHSKPLAVRLGRGTAWARHGHGVLCVNRPLDVALTTRSPYKGVVVGVGVHSLCAYKLNWDCPSWKERLFNNATGTHTIHPQTHIPLQAGFESCTSHFKFPKPYTSSYFT